MQTSVPSNIRVPFAYVAFDPTRATSGPSILKYEALIIGQKLSAGSAPALKEMLIRSADDAANYFGTGSQIARMCRSWFNNNKTTRLRAIAIVDDGAGVAAQHTIAITGTCTAAGVLALTINGELIQVAAAVSDTAAAIAALLSAAINANSWLPCSSTVSSGTLTLTAKNKGTNGNDIDIRYNYNDGEVTPAGLAIAVTPSTVTGAGNPDVGDIIDVMGDKWYQVITMPWTDTPNLVAMETEMDDRFGPIRMLDGWVYISRRGTPGQLSSFGQSRNSPFITCMHASSVPNSPEELAAARAGQEAASLENDPAQPVHTLELVGILPPNQADRFTFADNNGLLFDGISTFNVDNGNKMRIQQAITMYRTNAMGAVDIAFLKVNTMATLCYIRYDLRNTFLTKYPRAKLANDGGRIPSGMQIMTPKIGKAECINIFKKWQDDLAICEGLPQFMNDLVVERDPSDPDRLKILIAPNLVNQLDVIAALVQFILN